MTGKTNTGGASAGAVKKGTIVVKYPEGATCTVTGNGKTYTALDTSGAAAFVVEPGEWTATAVQDSENASESVTVTAGGWVEVELLFWHGQLYDAGNEYEKYTGGWKVSAVKPDSGATPQTPAIEKTETSIICKSNGLLHTTNKIDLTDFSTVVFEGTFKGNSNSPTWLQSGIWSSIGSLFGDNKVAGSQISSTLTKCTIDCYGLTGEYYVGIGRYRDSTSIEITKAWLE